MPEELTIEQLQAIQSSAECLYTCSDVDIAIAEMAKGIALALGESKPLLLCTMIGGIVTMGKLLENLDFPLSVDYIHATRYRGALQGSSLSWVARPTESLKGRVVLIVDDIFDEGLTLEALIKDCLEQGASKVYSAILLNKTCDKKVDIKVDFVGLSVENRYVFGSGMDYKGYLRNVSGIYAITDTP